jgi:DMSO/TMAO reductase YedYZ molybdopterin-dependent catalytic subunit
MNRTRQLLRIEGEVERPCTLASSDLAALPDQIPDAGKLAPGREGVAVPLRVLLAQAGVRSAARYLTVVSTDGGFAASVPLDAVQEAILVYRLGDRELPVEKGGPFRFLIPDAASCRRAEIDTCANVKFVGTLRLGVGPGEDSRPTSPGEHHALHRKSGSRRKV